jgi:predicted NACHT family NTPase
LLDQGEEAQGQRLAPQPHKFQDLRQLLHALPDYPALVLLGPPGSGKSTLLCHVELDYAQEALAGDDKELAAFPVTFFISLNRYRPEEGQPLPPPGDWLEQRWETLCPDLPPLDTLLQEGRMILLLDPLNEMPHQGTGHIEAWRQFLVQLAEKHSRNRVIFSCRTQDYGIRLSSNQLRVHQVRIDEQISSIRSPDATGLLER